MKVSTMVCALGWGSSFVLVWAVLLGAVEKGWLSLGALIFFVVLGIGGGAFSYAKPTG